MHIVRSRQKAEKYENKERGRNYIEEIKRTWWSLLHVLKDG